MKFTAYLKKKMGKGSDKYKRRDAEPGTNYPGPYGSANTELTLFNT